MLDVTFRNCNIFVNGTVKNVTIDTDKNTVSTFSHFTCDSDEFKCFFCKRKVKHYDPHMFRCGLRRKINLSAIKTHILVSKMLSHGCTVFEGLKVSIVESGFYSQTVNTVLIHTSNGKVYCNVVYKGIVDSNVWLLAGVLQDLPNKQITNTKPIYCQTSTLPDPNRCKPGTVMLATDTMTTSILVNNCGKNEWVALQHLHI